MVTLFWERSNFNLSSTSHSLSPLLFSPFGWSLPEGKITWIKCSASQVGSMAEGLFTGLSSSDKDQRVYTKKGKPCHVCIDHHYLCSALAFGGNTWRYERDRWQLPQVPDRGIAINWSQKLCQMIKELSQSKLKKHLNAAHVGQQGN